MSQPEQSRVAVPVETTMVQASAKLANGEEVKIEIPVQHGKGTQEGIILAHALGILRQIGGMTADNVGNLDYYPLSAFTPPIKFEVKRVSLITSGV
jgi:hypothetical protein